LGAKFSNKDKGVSGIHGVAFAPIMAGQDDNASEKTIPRGFGGPGLPCRPDRKPHLTGKRPEADGTAHGKAQGKALGKRAWIGTRF